MNPSIQDVGNTACNVSGALCSKCQSSIQPFKGKKNIHLPSLSAQYRPTLVYCVNNKCVGEVKLGVSSFCANYILFNCLLYLQF